MEYLLEKKTKDIINNFFIPFVSILTLIYLSFENFLFFHTISELISILIAFSVFLISINTFETNKNNYLIFIGIAYGFIAFIDLSHTLTYKGMGIFNDICANVPTQLWIAGRYMESISLLIANVFIYRKVNAKKVFLIYLIITFILLLSIFKLHIFPNCFIENEGLTLFKKVSEYIISFILLLSIIYITINRDEFNKNIFLLIVISLILTILSELLFTYYIDVYGISNMFGHIFKVISFYLVYKALIKTGLEDPTKLMFHRLDKTRTELIKRNNSLKGSEKRFRKLIEFSPDAIVVYNKGEILYCNSEFLNLVDIDNINRAIGKDIYDSVHPEFKDKLINYKKGIKELKLVSEKNRVFDVEVSINELFYKGKPSMYAVIRDVTENKRELNRASLIQKRRAEKEIPLPRYVNYEKIYKPYFVVSGDFFHYYKLNDNSFIGILGDVTGKGIAAALYNSALKVLFNDAILENKKPLDILNYVNTEIQKSFNEDYVAACCFSFDFKNNEFKIASAGINEFLYKSLNKEYEKMIIKGPFLGMFSDSIFEKRVIKFSKGDKFFFYSDGLEEIFDNNIVMKECFKYNLLSEQVKFIEENIETVKRKDDSTCLAFEIK